MNSTGRKSFTNQVEVWVPLRISGFFQMMDPNKSHNFQDFAQIGSRGGGPALDAFGKTIILRENIRETDPSSKQKRLAIFIEGQECTTRAKTSLSAVKLMQTHLPAQYSIKIYHSFELPQGSGYGSSGAGALGITFGLNKLFNLDLSTDQLGKYAHMAEVMNHTGLGTVGGQFVGGLSISMEPGFPFHMRKIEIPADVRIVVGSFGPLSTKKILTDEHYKKLIHITGKRAMEQMQSDFSLSNYMGVCHNFLEEIQLVERLELVDLQRLITNLNRISDYGASMNMLGKSVFCFCDKDEIEEVIKEFKHFKSLVVVNTLKIYDQGPIFKI